MNRVVYEVIKFQIIFAFDTLQSLSEWSYLSGHFKVSVVHEEVADTAVYASEHISIGYMVASRFTQASTSHRVAAIIRGRCLKFARYEPFWDFSSFRTVSLVQERSCGLYFWAGYPCEHVPLIFQLREFIFHLLVLFELFIHLSELDSNVLELRLLFPHLLQFILSHSKLSL